MPKFQLRQKKCIPSQHYGFLLGVFGTEKQKNYKSIQHKYIQSIQHQIQINNRKIINQLNNYLQESMTKISTSQLKIYFKLRKDATVYEV